MAPGFFRGGSGGSSDVSVLSQVSGASVLYLRCVHYVMTVMSELDMGLQIKSL